MLSRVLSRLGGGLTVFFFPTSQSTLFTDVKKETEEHFTSAANEDADVFEENPVENDGGHSDNTVNKETAVDDEPIKQPAAPSPYKTESEVR